MVGNSIKSVKYVCLSMNVSLLKGLKMSPNECKCAYTYKSYLGDTAHVP